MNNPVIKWLLFLVLCVVWGSSFILMKLGMYGSGETILLNAWQVAALRIFSAGLVLLPFLLKAIRRIPRNAWGYIALSGLAGNFLPAFLFCIAETKIDSALTAMLNTLTPICALLIGIVVYKSKVSVFQWLGVAIGFIGCIILFRGDGGSFNGGFFYPLLVVLATICYGINVNMVRNKLSHIASPDIAAGAFAAFLLPSAGVLLATGFHRLPLTTKPYLLAISSTCLLGILGTAIATVVFYKLVKIAGPVFSSMVTYGIPFVAIGWGLLYGEKVSGLQVFGLVVILAGVYTASRTLNKAVHRRKTA